MGDIGATAKCAPPLRSIAEQRDLWKRLADVTTIGSDHSPSPPEMKSSANFFEVWGGISGCQHLLPLLVDAANDPGQEVSREQIAGWTSGGVAQRFRIAGKGAIAVGNDADLTLVDPEQAEMISAETLRYRHRQSPYVGRQVRCRIVRTILRGQTIFDDGKITATAGGQFVRPHYS